jgi:hypothetical protein
LDISSFEIYKYLWKLLKCFNNGGQVKILRNVAAYFNTEIPDLNHIDPIYMPFVESRLQVYNDTLIQRARSAVIVQKWWRAHRDLKKSKLNIIVEINRARAVIRLQRWARNITFRHRIRFNREYRFYEKTIHSNSFYLQIYIYMKLPPISDYLKINGASLQRFV